MKSFSIKGIAKYAKQMFSVHTPASGGNDALKQGGGSSITCTKGAKLAVIVHVYYIELWPTIATRLKSIDVPYDLYVSVRENEKNVVINKISQFHGKTNVLTFSNRGRDVLPFLKIAEYIYMKGNYDYFLKLHTKKSLHRIDGDQWLSNLLDELVPHNISHIITTLNKKDTGAIGPRSHVVSLSQYMGDNWENINEILRTFMNPVEIKSSLDNAGLYPFFGGTMFWARFDLIKPLLNGKIRSSDFDDEKGQVDGTYAHALERVFGGLLHSALKRRMFVVSEYGETKELKKRLYEDKYKYVG